MAIEAPGLEKEFCAALELIRRQRNISEASLWTEIAETGEADSLPAKARLYAIRYFVRLVDGDSESKFSLSEEQAPYTTESFSKALQAVRDMKKGR